MFKTPEREFIKILDTKITVIIDDDRLLRENADGLYDEEVITLKSKYHNEDHYKRIFFHECFHALCDILGLQLDLHTEECLAHNVSKMYLIFPH